MNLFESESFELKTFETKEDWKQARKAGTGGSEAAAFLGYGFKSLREMWQEKKGMTAAPDLSHIPAVAYGTQAEEHLRALYRLKHPALEVQYHPNCMLVSKSLPWMFYSPDGLIWDPDRGRGILEVKTYNFKSRLKYEEDWGTDIPENHKVPISYYCQVLHGLIVTGFDFVTFTAEIIYPNKTSRIIERTFDRSEVLEDMETLLEAEKAGWRDYFENDCEPPVILHI